jgi:hypothetical protein
MLFLSDPERSVDASGQDSKKHSQQKFSLLGDTQLLLHILQAIKAAQSTI